MAETTDKPVNYSVALRLLPYFKPHWKRVLVAIFTILLVTGVRLLQPLILRQIIDVAIPAGDIPYAVKAVLFFIACLIMGSLVSYFQVVLLAKMGTEIIAGMKKQLFSHIVHQGMRFFDRHRVGTLLTRSESDVDQLKSLFTNSSSHIIHSIVMLFGIAAIILWEQPGFGVWICVILPLTAVVLMSYVRYIRKIYRSIRERNSEMTGYVTEYIQGVPLIQLYSRKKEVGGRLCELNKEKADIEIRAMMIDYVFFWPTFGFITDTLVIIAVFYFGGNLVFTGALSIGTLVMFIELLRQFAQPLQELAQVISQVQSSLAAAMRVFEIMDTPSDVTNEGSSDRKVTFGSLLEFKDVGFAYNQEKVLHDVNLSVKPGEHIAIVGASGSGKTTCINLLLRFYDPTTGSLRIDGTDIREFRLTEWRKKLSLVLQEIYLFPGTIMENLKALDNGIPDERAIWAAKTVGAHDFISSRKEGYSTILAERGANLSHGELQLISYARALVTNPDILILDEATASVDVITERALQASMEKLLEGRTALIIAHRLSTIRNADRIIVFEKGRIVEEGSHSQLMEKGGIYHRLVSLQAVAEKSGPKVFPEEEAEPLPLPPEAPAGIPSTEVVE